jgi:hypothetical protein
MTIELTDTQVDSWLARLENPATKRFEKQLRNIDDPEAMCCLGHLADIIDPNGWVKDRGAWRWAGDAWTLPQVSYLSLFLNRTLMADVNDNQHLFPIPEIRQWIEKARAQ